MPSYESLGASKYVIDGYVRAAEAWRHYEDHGDDDALRAVADTLCQTLGRLSGDQEFWGAAIDAIADLEGESDAVEGVLANLGEFREFEEHALRKFGVPPDQASRLASDLILAIRMAEDFPSGSTVLNLKNRVCELGEKMCKVAAADQPQRHNWRRRIGLGMKVLGGATLAVVDGMTAPIPPIALASIGGSLLVMGAEAFDE